MPQSWKQGLWASQHNMLHKSIIYIAGLWFDMVDRGGSSWSWRCPFHHTRCWRTSTEPNNPSDSSQMNSLNSKRTLKEFSIKNFNLTAAQENTETENLVGRWLTTPPFPASRSYCKTGFVSADMMIATKGKEHIASVKRAGNTFGSTVICSMWKHWIRTYQEHHKRRKHGAADKLAPTGCITRRQTLNTFNDSKVMR